VTQFEDNATHGQSFSIHPLVIQEMIMSEVKELECSSCGAPLMFNEGELQVKCKYCGSVLAVPEHMRPAQPMMNFATPVIHIQTGPMIDGMVYTSGKRTASRSLGCFGIFLTFFILAVTVVPVLLVTNSVNGIVNSVMQQIPALQQIPGIQNVAQAAAGFASESASFGGDGTGAGLFQDPRQLAIDGSGNIYVSDYDTGRIQRFDANGTFLNTWTIEGKKPKIKSMAADRSGNLYVIQDFVFPTAPILKFNGSTGKLIKTLTNGKDDFESVTVLPDGNLLAYVQQTGSVDGLLKLSPDGKVINRSSGAVSAQNENNNNPINAYLAADGLGNAYIFSPFDRAVFKFNTSGKFSNKWGKQGDKPGDFKSLGNAIAVDGKGRVYVGDFGRILVFDADGRYIDMIPASTYPTFDIEFNNKNEMYVLSQSKVRKFTLNSAQ
jgi:LSD1 subclass zinc finger protein